MKNLFTLIYLFITACSISTYAENYRDFKLGTSNIGKEFYLSFHPASEYLNSQSKIKIFISSDVQTTVEISLKNKSILETHTILPYQINEIEISALDAMLYIPNPDIDDPAEDIWKEHAIIVKAEEPIICTAVLDFENNQGGYQALPKSALGREYVVSTYYNSQVESVRSIKNYVSVVGAYNGTKVKFVLGGNIHTSTPGGMQPGDEITFFLEEGDIWLLPSKGLYSDLSGSSISASKPVAAYAGTYSYDIEANNSYCDYTIEQLFPIKTWGKTYHIPEFKYDQNNTNLEIFSSVGNNDVFIDGIFTANIQFSTGIKNQAYILKELFRNNELPRPVTVTGSDNISCSVYPNYSPVNHGFSEQISVAPLEQYSNQLVFITPELENNTAYYNLSINYIADQEGRIPADLLLGEFDRETNSFKWLPVRNNGNTSIKNYHDPSAGGSINYSNSIIRVKSGSYYILKSDNPIMAYLTLSDKDRSFGFPAFTNAQYHSINDTLSPILNSSKISTREWNIKIDDRPLTDFNSLSGLAFIDFSETKSYNFEFEHADFITGVTNSVTGSLSISDLNQNAYAEIYVSDKAGNDTVFTFSYIAPQFDIYPKEDTFSDYSINDDPVIMPFILRNFSETEELIVENLFLSESAIGFQLITDIDEFPINIAAQDSMEFEVQFDPSIGEGVYTAYINVNVAGVVTPAEEVQASVGTPILFAADLLFENTIEGDSNLQYLNIQNIGTYQLTILNIDMPKNSVFEIEELETPATIDPGEEIILKANFLPQNVGTFTDTIHIESDSYGMSENAKTFFVLQGTALPTSIEDLNKIKLSIKSVREQTTGNLEAIIQTDHAGNYDIHVIDILGRTVYQSNVYLNSGENTYSIPFVNTSNKTYFLILEKDNNRTFEKFFQKN